MDSKDETWTSIIKEAVSKLLILWTKDNKFLKSLLVKNDEGIDIDATLNKLKEEIKDLIK